MYRLRLSYLIRLCIVFAVFLNYFKINAQDLHYSQFYNSPQNLNPSLTGVFNGDHRIVMSLRDQWRFVPVPWFTFSGAYDRRFHPFSSEKHFLGGGINLNHDRQGDSQMNLTSLSVSGSYHYLLTPKHILSGGLTLGLASRGFNTQNLTWDKQWNGEVFDPSLSSGEQLDNFNRFNFIETGLGLNYRYQRHSRSHVDIGYGMLHVLKPTAAFTDIDNTSLPRRQTMHVLGSMRLTHKFDIQLHGLYQIQDQYNETVYGGLGKFYVSQKRGKQVCLDLGLGYRTSKSFIPTIAVGYNQWYASFSFDFDNTEFNQILNSNRGGPEFHFRYIITNVKSSDFKNCPIY